MNYLLYIEYSAENLQFYMWFRDYIKRFDKLPQSEKLLSPPIDPEKLETENLASPKMGKISKTANETLVSVFKGSSFAAPGTSPFEAESPLDEKSIAWSDASTVNSSKKTDYQNVAAVAFESAEVKVQPCKLHLLKAPIVC
jgi:hypothetical protein